MDILNPDGFLSHTELKHALMTLKPPSNVIHVDAKALLGLRDGQSPHEAWEAFQVSSTPQAQFLTLTLH